MEFLRTLGSAIGTPGMFLGSTALRRHCAVRIRTANSWKITIAKTRYVAGPILLKWVLRGRSRPEARLQQPPVDRFTPDRFRRSRKNTLSDRSENFSSLHFPKMLQIFTESCSQSENNDFWPSEPLSAVREVPEAPGSAYIRFSVQFPTFPCVRRKSSHFWK